MHRAFANSEVRVLVEISELFQTFWRVVDCVPTYGTCPEKWRINLGTKVQKSGILVTLGWIFQGSIPVQKSVCTGMGKVAIPVMGRILYRYVGLAEKTRGSGLLFRRSHTGTNLILYRYGLAVFAIFETAGTK